MKKIIMSCGLAAAFILNPILATAEESSNYALFQGTINQHASWAKVAVLMDVAAAQAQVFSGATASGDKKADSRKLCFRLGSVLTSIIGSAARYGRHAKDPLEKNEARQTMILGLSAATYCGFDAQDVLNPDYSKMAAGGDVFSKVQKVSTTDELTAVLRQIVDLNKIK